jgi:hypothetical protein
MTPKAVRRGITFLEIAVILVVALTLLGLGMFFLFQQREAAQRMHCGHNLLLLGKAIHAYHDKGPKPAQSLPPARIAEGYATWVVLIAPFLKTGHALETWELSKPYQDQPATVREAWLTEMFCPSRFRPGQLSGPGEAANLPGAVGDYGCVAGNGQTDWTGLDANGPMVQARVLEKKGDLILRWQSQTNFDSLKRGKSYTLLLGEKHVPMNHFGQAGQGDGAVVNVQNPAYFSRIGGPGFPLATSPEAPFHDNFGSYHPGITQFLYADLSVRPLANDINEQVLGELATRE